MSSCQNSRVTSKGSNVTSVLITVDVIHVFCLAVLWCYNKCCKNYKIKHKVGLLGSFLKTAVVAVSEVK